MSEGSWLRAVPPSDTSIREMVFRGLLSIGLYAAFPAFSDIYRLWRREHGITAGFAVGEIEYPPLGALYFEPLSHLPSSRWAVIVNGLVMLAAAVAVTMALIAAQRRRYSGGRVELRMWVASPALLLLMPVNWDVLLTAVALAAVIAIYEDRVTESGLLLGVGTSLKLSPGFMVAPLLPLIEGWSRRLRFLGGGAVILGGSYLVYWLVRPDTWRTHLEFATTRDDYNSTIWGLLESLLGLLGIDMSNETITIISSIAVALGITALMVWVWYRRPSVVAAAALSMIVLLQLTKVFKPQYLLWVLPLLAWAGVRRAWVWVLEAAVLLQFAVIYFEIPALLDSFATMARLVAFVVVGWELIDRGRSRPAAVGGT